MYKLKSIFLLSYALLAIFLGLFFTKNTNAYHPALPTPDPWFTLTLEIDSSNLPSGIKVEGDKISNSTTTPLFISKRTTHYGLELNNNRIIAPSSNNGKDVPLGNEYKYTVRYGDENLILDRPLEEVRRDNRPQDVILPKPHTFSFPAKYGEKPITITGEITYALNPNYNPKASEQSQIQIDEMNENEITEINEGAENNNEYEVKQKWPIVAGSVFITLVLVFLFRKHKSKNGTKT